MSTIVFVHGTGTRQRDFDLSFADVSAQVGKYLKSGSRPCYWGGTCGAVLHANGASIPEYQSTGGDDDKAGERAAWELLYRDPLFELRLLPQNTDDAKPANVPGRLRTARSESMPLWLSEAQAPDLHVILKAIDFITPWQDAIAEMLASVEFRELIDPLPDGPIQRAVARALVARSTTIATRMGIPATSGDQRDELVANVAKALRGGALGVFDWMGKKLTSIGQPYVENRRGRYSNGAVPKIGDILVYQLRGREISGVIDANVRAVEGPVIIVAHSLGGIAALELLIEHPPKNVRALVTIGSQAPLFYELDCLRSLRFGKALPEDFSPWFNVYDHSDFLSYVGEGLFGHSVKDILVNNGQPFPQSHSAYWKNDDMWAKLAASMEERGVN